MSRRETLFIAFAGCLFVGSQVATVRAELQNLMGTVHEQSAQQLQIRTTEGNIVSVGLGMDTRFELQGKAAKPGDLKPGVRVVVEAEDVGGQLLARLVRIGVTAPPTAGQGHEGHRPPRDERTPDHQAMQHEQEMSTTLGISHTREGSGTAWLSDTTPMFAVHRQAGRWEVMLHGNVFVGYNYQGSDRGDEQFSSPNWLMIMARRPLAGGEFSARGMLSLDPLTVGKDGYPLLLQTGESFEGVPLHDRQHPHELFMETAVTYSRPITDAVAFQLYAAPVGEPALGPAAFPHRASASSDPLAPLSHHWQDSSHITFGVVTAGLFTRRFKAEGSWFNGREPDEDRYDFDFRAFDSFSGRFAINPTENLSLQASFGFLESPEGLKPETSLHRVTMSATHTVPFRAKGSWATTGVWGRNKESGETPTDAFLIESNLDFDGRNTVFGRAEIVEKSGGDLVLPPPNEEKIFDVGSVVLGYLREFGHFTSFVPGIGVRGSINFIRDDLRPFYGTNQPAGVMVFLRVRAAPMEKMEEMKTMEKGDRDKPMHH